MSRRFTWHAPDGVHKNQIDYILISKRAASGIQTNNTRSFPGADIGSDHDLVMMTMRVKIKTHHKQINTRVKYNLEKLSDPNIKLEFQNTIGGKFAPLLLLENPQEMVDEMTREFSDAAEKILGRKRIIKQPWVLEDTLKLCDLRREKKGKRFDGEEQAKEYRAANRMLRQKLGKDKEAWITKQCGAIEANIKYNTKEAYRIVKRITKSRQPRLSILDDKKGKPLVAPKAVAERWREYCQELYNFSPTRDNNIPVRLRNKQRQEQEAYVTRGEIEEAVKKLKNDKSTGIDNIPGELIKHGGSAVIDLLQKICNKIWLSGEWPKQWTHSIIIPLPKKGNLRQCSNYRTISLISHPSKVMIRILLNRLQPQIENHLADEQAGFRHGRSTVEQILNLRILCEKHIEHKRELHHNFIDFKKAFDRVWHEGMWSVMEKYNISEQLVKVIKALYSQAQCSVLTGNEMSRSFTPAIGVRQGCPLSPCMFNLFLEQIMTETLENFEGTISIGGRKVNNLRFADDIDLLGGTNEELHILTDRLDKTATAYGMSISEEKSKILRMGVSSEQSDIRVTGGILETVKTFKYLGATITEDGRSDTDIKIRLAIATGTLARLKRIWNDRKISVANKIRFMRAIVVSTALYGCESWTLNSDSERRIQAFEFKCLRRILNVHYTEHRTNDSIWMEVVRLIGPQEHLLATVKRRKMTWFGHINRSRGLANTIMQGMVDGRRGRGRPRTSWLDNIKKWTGLTAEEIHKMTKDRKRWRDTLLAASQVMPLRSLRTRDK